MLLDLTLPGAYARAGGGNQEIPDIQKQVVSWIAWSINADNGGGGGMAVWEKAIGKWNAAGLANFPWMHVRSMGDLERLVSVGEAKNAPAIGVNIEDIVGDKLSLQEIGGYLLDFWVNRYEKPVHMPTLCWVQNGQGWQYVGFAICALEMFYDEVPACRDVSGCVKHALDEGFSTVTLMFKTKLPPSEYDLSVCHSLYTSDDITPTLAAWLPWKGPSPCKPYVKETNVPLTPTQKKKFREQLRRFCLVAQKYDHRWHYTQQRPYTGLGAPASDTHFNDCSSYVAIAFYKAGRNSAVKVDDPLGWHYTGWGNTGSCYSEMKQYPAPVDKYRIGDVALYLDPGGFGDHMTVCIQEGTGQTSVWSSFGTEAGPDERSLHYRSDLTGVYRPEDLR